MIDIHDTNLINIEEHKDVCKYMVFNSTTIGIFPKKGIEITSEKITNGRDWYNYAPADVVFLESLNLSDVRTIKVGDVIVVKITDKYNYYPINFITTSENGFLLKTHIPNKTSVYLLPCLEGSKTSFSYNGYMINAYIDEDGKHINVLYRYFSDKFYKNIEFKLSQHKLYLSTKDINNEYVIHKFKIPEEHINDVVLFTKGHYSKLSKKLKDRILKFHNKSKSSELYGILHKTEEQRNKLEHYLGINLPKTCELDSRPDLCNEYYKYDLYKILIADNERISDK